jgi:hypothetical protein
MRTTLDLPDHTFRKLKAEASLRGLKLKEMVCQFIESGLAAQASTGRIAQPRRSPLPLIRKPGGLRHPSLTNAEIHQILTQEEWHGSH